MRRFSPRQRIAAVGLAIFLGRSMMPVAMAQATATAIPSNPSVATPAPADKTYPGVTLEATMGYEGKITYLRKIPITISLANQGESLTGTLALNVFRNHEEYDRYEMPVFVASQAEVQVVMPVEMTIKQPLFQLELLVNGQVVATKQLKPAAVMDPYTMLVGTLTDKPRTLSQFVYTKMKDPLKRGELWQVVPLTLDNFPNDTKMLESFSFLVVDGVDLSGLKPEQQAAFDQWLKNGGIAIVGGGAQAGSDYPFFEPYTGISLGALAESQVDITEALLSYVKAVEKPVDSPVLLSEMKGAQKPLVYQVPIEATEEQDESGSAAPKEPGVQSAASEPTARKPIIDLTIVEKGCVITTAFSLSDKPMGLWLSDTAFWQRLMITALSGSYRAIVEKHVNYSSREMDYIDGSIMNGIPVKNDSSFLVPLILLIAFVLLVGFGSYWFLKKKDKRDWMWASIPGLSIAFVLLLLLLSNGLEFRKPVAVSSTLIRQDKEGQQQGKTAVSITAAQSEPMTVSADQGQIRVSGNQSNYYQTEENEEVVVHKLRYVYNLGSDPSITFPAEAAWQVNSFFLEGAPISAMRVKGECWWETDGLHISIENDGERPLQEGFVITSLGYCKVQMLLPGEKAQCLIRRLTQAETDKINAEPIIQEGVLLTTLQQNQNNIYGLSNAIAYPESQGDTYAGRKNLSEDEIRRRDLQTYIIQNCFNNYSTSDGRVQFFYISIDDALSEVNLRVGGEPVTRKSQKDAFCAELTYQAISKDGIVNYTRGMIPVFEAIENAAGELSCSTEVPERYRYYRLNEKPIFCFVVPQEIRKMKVTAAEVGVEYIYAQSTMSMYNQQTKEWDEIQLGKSIKDLDFSKYLTTQGELFVRFEPSTATTEYYAEMTIPYLVLEGEIQ